MKAGALCARSSIAADAAARMFAMWCGGAGSAPGEPLERAEDRTSAIEQAGAGESVPQLPPFGEKVLHVLPGSTIDRAISALRADSAIVAANGGFEVGGEIPQCSTAQTTALFEVGRHVAGGVLRFRNCADRAYLHLSILSVGVERPESWASLSDKRDSMDFLALQQDSSP